MAIQADGTSTYRDAQRRRKEGVQAPPLNAGVEVQPTTEQLKAQAKVEGAPPILRSNFTMISSFDPKERRRGGTGLSAPAGSPTTPFTAKTLDELNSLVNKNAQEEMAKATAVPTANQVPIPPPEPEKPVEVKPPTFSERIKAVNEESESALQALQSQPASTGKNEQYNAIITQRNQDLARIKSEQDLLGKFSDVQSEISMKRYDELVENGIDPRSAYFQVVRENKILSDDSNKLELSNFLDTLELNGEKDDLNNFSRIYDFSNKNIDDTYDVYKSRYGEVKARKIKDDFLRENNWDEISIEQDNFKNTIKDLYVGNSQNPQEVGILVNSLKGKYSDEFINTQLNSIISSPFSSEDVKDEARAFLGERVSGQIQITKNQFGEIVGVNKITNEIIPIENVSQAYTVDPIGTLISEKNQYTDIAEDLNNGSRTASEIETLYGPRKAQEIGQEASRLRSIEKSQGQKLSTEEVRKMESQLRQSNDFKSIDKAEASLNALIEFEKRYNEVGFEFFRPGRISPQYTNALLNLKEFYNLGVLNGADLTVMQGILPPPFIGGKSTGQAEVGGFASTTGEIIGQGLFGLTGFQRKTGVNNGLNTLKSMMKEQLIDNIENIKNQYEGLGNIPAKNKAIEQANRMLEKLGNEIELNEITDEQINIFQNLSEDQLNQLTPEEKSLFENYQGSRPERNNNPGNIKIGGVGDKFAEKNSDGTPKTDDQGHLIFKSSENGINALRSDIEAKLNGKSKFSDILGENPTISDLNNVYAEDPNWKNNVASILGVDINTPAGDVNINDLIRAIAKAEGGESLLNEL